MGLMHCNNGECLYNRRKKCHSHVLEIGDKGQCRSYKDGMATRNTREGEFAAELGIEGRDMYDAIDCYAACAFNVNVHCTAGNIDMKDGLFSTKCTTRIKP